MSAPESSATLATSYRAGLYRFANLAANWAFIAILAIVGATLLVWGGRGFPEQPMSFLRGPAGFVELGIIGLTFGGIGAFLATRLPGHAVGWSLILIGVGVALHVPASFLVGQTLGSFRPVSPPLLISVWLLTSAFVPLAITLIAYLLMIMPDGRLHSRRWVGPVAVLVLGFVTLTVATALEPTGLVWFPTLPNPLGTPRSAGPAIAAGRFVGVGFLIAGLVLAAVAIVRCYRRGDPTTRRQLRWIAGGAVVWVATLAPFVVVRYLTGASEETGTWVLLVAAGGTLAIPISIFVATTRYHLFGIEAFVGRTLVYVPLMGICGGLYAAGLALAQRLFVGLTGNTSDAAVIMATLLMAAAITPVRRLLESGVDRIMAAGRRHSDAAGQGRAEDDTGDYVHLNEQAQLLAARLQDVEHRLAALGPLEPRDRSREVGEPGVGMAASAASIDPAADRH